MLPFQSFNPASLRQQQCTHFVCQGGISCFLRFHLNRVCAGYWSNPDNPSLDLPSTLVVESLSADSVQVTRRTDDASQHHLPHGQAVALIAGDTCSLYPGCVMHCTEIKFPRLPRRFHQWLCLPKWPLGWL